MGHRDPPILGTRVPEPQKNSSFVYFFEAPVPVLSSHVSNSWNPIIELCLCPHGEVLHLNLFWNVLDLPQVYFVNQNKLGKGKFRNFQIDLLQMTQ